MYDQEWYEGRFDASMSSMSKALGLHVLYKVLDIAATLSSINAITMFIIVCTQAIDDAARFPEYFWLLRSIETSRTYINTNVAAKLHRS